MVVVVVSHLIMNMNMLWITSNFILLWLNEVGRPHNVHKKLTTCIKRVLSFIDIR